MTVFSSLLLFQCKYHSDPDHGRLWAYDTVVVSVGETRRFNLREIIPTSTMKPSYHTPTTVVLHKKGQNNMNNDKISMKPSNMGNSEEQTPHSFHLYNGDVFYMFGDCQDTFQHCVLKSEGEQNNAPRSSIVFKKSLPGVGGRRGHGIVKQNIINSGSSSSNKEKNVNQNKNRIQSSSTKQLNIVNSKSNPSKLSPTKTKISSPTKLNPPPANTNSPLSRGARS